MRSALLEAVPDDPFHIFRGGEPDTAKVLKILRYGDADVAAAAHVSVDEVRFDEKMPPEIRERAREWALAIALVASYFKDLDRTMLWFSAKNPLLGDVSPRAMIRLGRSARLLKFIRCSLDENVAAETESST